MLLLVVCTRQLADVGTLGASFLPVLILAGVLAIAFSVRADLVGAGMGLIGVMSQTLDRRGANQCISYSPAHETAYFVGSGLFILALVGLRLVLTPIRGASRLLSGATNFWTSPG